MAGMPLLESLKHHGNALSLIGFVLTMGFTARPSYSFESSNAALATTDSPCDKWKMESHGKTWNSSSRTADYFSRR